MDSYLESLITKENKEVEPVEEVAKTVEEIKDVAVDPTPEVHVSQSADIVGETKTEAFQSGDIIDPDKEEKQPEPSLDDTTMLVPPTCYEEGKTYPVKDIRVYNTPDLNQVARIISGNVIYRGSICGFKIIEYMKHGFGLAKGYTQDNI